MERKHRSTIHWKAVVHLKTRAKTLQEGIRPPCDTYFQSVNVYFDAEVCQKQMLSNQGVR